MRTIRSPINGVVVERFMSPGEFPKQERILKLAQLHPLRVEAYVPISMLGKITVGMEVQVKPEEPVSGTYKAKVTVVDHVVDAGSGTLGIRMELPNPDLKIPAGLNAPFDSHRSKRRARLPLKPPRTRIDSPHETPRIAMEMDMGAMFRMGGGHRRRDCRGCDGLPCLVKPKVIVAVGSPIPGLLTQLTVDQGDTVKEGQVLALLEASIEQTEVEVAKAEAEMEAAITSTQVKAEFSQRKASRARNLTTSSAIASNEFDEAETEQRVTEVRTGRRWKISFWRNGSWRGRRRPWRCVRFGARLPAWSSSAMWPPANSSKINPSCRSLNWTRCMLKYWRLSRGWGR